MNPKILTFGLGLSSFFSLQAKEKPNIVFILADDLGYGDLSCYGQRNFQTPNIDNLALNGIRFTQSYSGATVSAPSRASLLTGLHTGNSPIRGNRELEPEGQFPLPKGTFTLFTLFKNAGYTTGAFGKWGLGYPGSEGNPNNQGVDVFYGYNCQRQAHHYFPEYLWSNQTRVELPENKNKGRKTYAPTLIQKETLKFISENKDNPFFLFVPMTFPHAELLVPEDSLFLSFKGKFTETPYLADSPWHSYSAQDYPKAAFATMVSLMDLYVGQIVEELKKSGIYDNTFIVFTSDNGSSTEGGHDSDFFRSNGIYRGYKRDLYEGGIRVPTVISWKNKISQGKESHLPFAFWDYMPTFAEILGVKTKSKTDGISILPTLLNKKKQKKHDYFYYEFHEMDGKQAVIQGDWKLLYLDVNTDKPYFELYNISADPSENHNLIALYPRKVTAMKAIMQNARTEDFEWRLFNR